MQLKVPLSPKATIDRGLAGAIVAQGLWAAAGETGLGRTPSVAAKARMVRLLWSDPAMLAERGYLATDAGETKVSVVRGRDGPPHRPGFCEGEGVIEVEAGELIGDLVAALADACASALPAGVRRARGLRGR
jgi:hypothetical protein